MTDDELFLKYVFTVDKNGKDVKFSVPIPTYPDFGSIFQSGKVIMIVEYVDLDKGIIKFRPITPEEMKKYYGYIKSE